MLDALGGVGVRPVVYKGAALARTLYPTPACRPMGDVDLWVGAKEMASAQAALDAIGYPLQQGGARWPCRSSTRARCRWWGRGQEQGLVELHWGVFPGQVLLRTARIERAAVRQRCIPLIIAGRAGVDTGARGRPHPVGCAHRDHASNDGKRAAQPHGYRTTCPTADRLASGGTRAQAWRVGS